MFSCEILKTLTGAKPGCDKVAGPHNWPGRAAPRGSVDMLPREIFKFRLSQMSSPALSGHV